MSAFRRPPAVNATTRRRAPASVAAPAPSASSSNSSSNATAAPSAKSNNNNNIQVVVRCRGVSPSEVRQEAPVIATVPSTRGSTVTLTDPSVATATTIPRSWDFGNNVYGPSAKQAMVYDHVAKPLLEQVLEGYNCTIFAYGQTGTGKTYTMEGDLSPNGATFHDEAGIIPRTLYYLFDHLASSASTEYTVKCSYVELYNEELRDLNAKPDQEGVPLRIYDEPSPSSSSSISSTTSMKSSGGGGGGSFHSRDLSSMPSAAAAQGGGGGSVRIEGLEETFITDAEEGLEVLRRGSMRRISASTNMNERSSRSHSIFTIIVALKDTPSSPTTAQPSNATTGASASRTSGLLRVGKLNLVDLAGSENVARSGAVQGRAREAGRINVSLLALGRVINMLSGDASTSGSSTLNGNSADDGVVSKKVHIPYRESKLTRLLQDSLGGNTKTTIIATISPTSYEETASTLSYALQATSIQNRPEANRRIGRDVVLNQVLQELSRCKADLKAARSEEGYFVSRESYQELELERQTFKQSLVVHNQTLSSLEIQKTELQSTRDQLDQNVRALTKTKDVLKRTADELAARERDVERLDSELEGVKVENEMLKCLTQAWEQSRKGWKEDAEDALDDVQGLRDKLSRKTVVEESNLSVLKDVSNSIKGRTRDIDQQTRRLLWSQSDFVHALERRIEGFSSRQNARFTEAGESIERFLVQLSAQLEAVSVGNSESRDSMTRYRRTIEETCRELFVRFTQHGTQATAEYDELSERIRDEVTRHESETSSLLDDLMSQLDSLRTECAARLEQDRTVLAKLTRDEIESLQVENDSLRHIVSSLETRFAQEESRQALEEASIVARIQAELASASERRRDNLQETLRSVRGQAGETAQARATESDTRQRAFAQLGGNNEAVRTTLERTLDECTLFKQGGLEQLGTSLDIVKQLETMQSDSSKRARAKEAHLLSTAASFVAESSTTHRMAEARSRLDSRRTLRSLVESTGDVLSAWSLSNKVTQDDTHASNQAALAQAHEYALATTDTISHVSGCNDALASQVQADLERRVRYDAPTGSTPRPKERRPVDRLFPLVDLDSNDRQSVLETLLKARDADIAAALAADEEERRRRDEDAAHLGGLDLGLDEGPDAKGPTNEAPALGKSMSRSPSLEVVSLPAIAAPRPRPSSVVVAAGGAGKATDLRRSRVGVLGERDTNVAAGAGLQPGRKPTLGAKGARRTIVKKSTT